MKTGIYMIRNKVNNKKYIGQAVDIELRWKTHIRELNDNNHHNRYLQRAWNKYGADNFEFTIVCLCEEDELDEFEIDMIAHFDTYNNGYNLTFGGDGVRGYKYTYEQRAKMREALNRPEIKNQRSEAIKGDKNPMKRPEVKAKMGETKKGDKNPMKRPEVRAKVSKKVYCVTNDTVYASTVEAGEKLGIGQGWISWCCQGKNITKKYPGGHHIRGLEFWYLDEYEKKFGKVAM